MDRQTFAPGHRQLDKPFGGLSIILIGDFAQLPPVGDSPLYSNSPKSSLQIHGHTMYQLFTTVVILSESLQQAGSVPDAVAFRSLLLGLRNGTVNESDWSFYLIGLHSSSPCHTCTCDAHSQYLTRNRPCNGASGIIQHFLCQTNHKPTTNHLNYLLPS